MNKYIRKYFNMCLIVTIISIISAVFVWIKYTNIKNGQGIACFNDYLVYYDYFGFEGVMLFPLLLISMYFLSSDKRVTILLRYGNMRRFWLNIIKNILIISIYISVIVGTVFLIVVCLYTSSHNNIVISCNWTELGSRYAYVSGKVLDRSPSIIEVCIYILAAYFFILYIAQIIINYFELITGSKLVGCLIGIIFIIIEKYMKIPHVLFDYITLMPGKSMDKYGVTPLRCFIYPLVLSIIVTTITCLLIRKRDILKETV